MTRTKSFEGDFSSSASSPSLSSSSPSPSSPTLGRGFFEREHVSDATAPLLPTAQHPETTTKGETNTNNNVEEAFSFSAVSRWRARIHLRAKLRLLRESDPYSASGHLVRRRVPTPAAGSGSAGSAGSAAVSPSSSSSAAAPAPASAATAAAARPCPEGRQLPVTHPPAAAANTTTSGEPTSAKEAAEGVQALAATAAEGDAATLAERGTAGGSAAAATAAAPAADRNGGALFFEITVIPRKRIRVAVFALAMCSSLVLLFAFLVGFMALLSRLRRAG